MSHKQKIHIHSRMMKILTVEIFGSLFTVFALLHPLMTKFNTEMYFNSKVYLLYFFQNYPLFIKTIQSDNELKFQYTVHTSLDVVEEKISSVGKNSNDLRELYLGLLYPTEDYKVYPYEIY